MKCEVCGHLNADGATVCTKCGAALRPVRRASLGASDQPRDPYAVSPGMRETLDRPSGDETDPMRAFIGPRNLDYYAPRFAAIEAAGGGLKAGWHWPAFFVTWYWMLYRKMWLPALGYFLLPILLSFVFGALAGITRTPAISTLYLVVYVVVVFALAPMYATSLYYRKYRSVLAATDGSTTSERTLARIEAKGGTSSVVLIILGVLLVGGGILAAVAIPAYSDYVKRAKASTVWRDDIDAAAPKVAQRRSTAPHWRA